MSNVGALNYKVNANVSGFQEGMVLSRSELALTRREMTGSRSDAEKLQFRLDTLEKAYKAGVIQLADYERTQAAVRARSQEAIAAAAAEAETLKRAADLTRKLMTDEEKLIEERKQLEQLKPHLSTQAYARAIDDLLGRMPETIAAEKARADAIAKTEQAQKRAADLMRKLMTDEEKLAAERRELEQLKPHLSTDQYARAIQDLNSRMPETIAAEKARADAIAEAEKAKADAIAKSDELQKRAVDQTRKMMTAEEQLAEERRQLEQLKPHLSAEAYARSIQDLNRRMPDAIRNEKQLAREQEAINQDMAEGRRITQSLETATERYSREVAELDRLLRRGSITQETHSRAMRQAGASLEQNQMATASQIPLVGNLASRVASATGSFGPYGAAIAVAAAELYVMGRAADHVIGRIGEQMQAIDAQSKAATRLGADMQLLAGIQFAGNEVSGVEAQGVDKAIEKLVVNIFKARDGNEQLARTFQTLKLDAAELANMDGAAAFREIAEQVSKMKNPLEQLAVARDLLGRQGAGLVEVLRQGAEGIDAATDKVIGLDGAMSAIDGAQVEAANDAIDAAHRSFNNLYNTLAIELSPAIQLTAGKIEDLGRWVGSTGEFFTNLIHHGQAAVGILTDLYNVAAGIVTLDWDQLSGGFAGDSTIALLEELEATEAANREAAERNKEKARQAQQDLAYADGLDGAGEDPAARAIKEVDAINKEIEAIKARNVELALGKDGAERLALAMSSAPDDLKQELQLRRDISAELERKKKIEDEAAKAKEQAEEKAKRAKEQAEEKAKRRAEQLVEKIKADALKVVESLRSPLDKVVDEIEDIRKLRAVGAIDQNTAERAEKAARDKFKDSSRPAASGPPAAVTRGSQEAYQLIASKQAEQRTEFDRRHLETLDAMKIQQELLERAAAATEKLAEAQGV